MGEIALEAPSPLCSLTLEHAARGLAPLDRLSRSHFDMLQRKPRVTDIEDSPNRRGHAHPIETHDVVHPEVPTCGVDAYTGERSHRSLGSWDRQMDGVRDDVAQLMKVERRLVRDDRYVPANSQPSRHNMLTRA